MLDKRKSHRVMILVEGEKRRKMTDNADSLDSGQIAEALLKVRMGISMRKTGQLDLDGLTL